MNVKDNEIFKMADTSMYLMCVAKQFRDEREVAEHLDFLNAVEFTQKLVS
jgi:hypothetical protein